DEAADVSQVSARLLDPSFDVAGFLGTRQLVAPPEQKRAATRVAPVVPAAKLRGTQIVSMSTAMAGLKQRAGTALLDPGALQAVAAAATPTPAAEQPARTSQLPARTSALVAAEPRRT